MSDNKTAGSFPIPGIALVVVALGILVFSDTTLSPSRPDKTGNVGAGAEDVIARLWQDPFEAVQLHRSEIHGKKNEQDIPVKYIRSKLQSSTYYSDAKHQVCVKGVPEKVKDYPHSISDLRCQIQRDIDNVHARPDLHVLAVMVSGGPYAENRENRIRSRYAVISGLSHAGYVPNDPEHIGYLEFTDLCNSEFDTNVNVQNTRGGSLCDWPATVPYEWFSLKKVSNTDSGIEHYSDNVLVVWLDDTRISEAKPLWMLNRLRDALTPGEGEKNIRDKYGKRKRELVKIKFDVIGPLGSTTLRKIYEEVDRNKLKEKDCASVKRYLSEDSRPNQPRLNRDFINFYKYRSYKYFGVCGIEEESIRLFSPRATIDSKALEEILGDSSQANQANQEGALRNSLAVTRTIPTDDMLVDELLQTIHDRLPKLNTLISDGKRKKDKSRPHMVLIGEWDTIYSRNFNRLFRNKLCLSHTQDDSEDAKSSSCKTDYTYWSHLHSFNYFRGLDGSTPGSAAKKIKQNSSNNGTKSKVAYRRPVGANQFDYLRRLGNQLSDLSKSLHENNEGRIGAIGIVGSDTYDKLLILQALRNLFPDVIFFTTDMDAQLLHPDENNWARNLVVATGYGLTPTPGKGHFEGLAFRENYQTSIFHATMMSIDKDVYSEPEKGITGGFTPEWVKQKVKILEVGNSRAIDYTSSEASMPSSSKAWAFLALSLVLVLLLLYQTSNKTRRNIFIFSLAFYSVIGLLYVLDAAKSPEFYEMISGTSIWPAIIIRATAGVLAIVFIFMALDQLKDNARYLASKHKFAIARKTLVDRLRFVNKRYHDKKISTKLYVYLVTMIRTMFRRVIKKRNKASDIGLSNFNYVFVTSWGWQYSKNEKVSASDLFCQYMAMTRTRCWLARVFIMTAVYFALSMLFVALSPSFPTSPISDAYSGKANFIVLLISVLSYLFLLFLVVDVTRVNARFVELLTKCKVMWERKDIKGFADEYCLKYDIASEKLKINLIVERANAVDPLIFLPFVILSLMIISRSSYFDRWYMSVELAVVIIVGALIALSSAVRLRRTAKKAQKNALKKLKDKYHCEWCKESANKNVKANPASPANMVKPLKPGDVNVSERVKLLIEEIENIQDGPFLPIARHPIVAAIAMPFGGIGSLYLIDYLTAVGA